MLIQKICRYLQSRENLKRVKISENEWKPKYSCNITDPGGVVIPNPYGGWGCGGISKRPNSWTSKPEGMDQSSKTEVVPKMAY